MKPFFGKANVYGHAYGCCPDRSTRPATRRPIRCRPRFMTIPSPQPTRHLSPPQNQQTHNGYGVNWQGQDGSDTKIGDFPSAHTMLATFNAITFAVLAPGYYQQLAQSVEEFAYDLNVFAVHYPLDVIGGRILGTYVLAQTLAGNPLYPSSHPGQSRLAQPGDAGLSRRRRQFALRGSMRRQRRRLRRRRRRSPAPRPTPSRSRPIPMI